MKKRITVVLKFIRTIIFKIVMTAIFWRVKGKFPHIQKYVVVLAPHKYGLFEIFLGLFVVWSTNLQSQFVLIKKEAFELPIIGRPVGWFLRKIGGISVDRNRKLTGRPKGSLIKAGIQEIKKQEAIALVITPEGTRIKNSKSLPEWKHGFYEIAAGADVPIVMVALDYSKGKWWHVWKWFRWSVIINPEVLYVSKDCAKGYVLDMAKISAWYEKTLPGYIPNIPVEKFKRIASYS